MADPRPILRVARGEELPAIAGYLARNMGGRGGEARYSRFFGYDWLADKPDLGVLLDDGGRIGGFVGAIYAHRSVRGQERLFCNINSWHVEERFRRLSLRMMERLLARRDCTYTCCSPSPRVVELLEFFKFRRLESAKVLFAPVSGLGGLLRGPRAQLHWGRQLERHLTEAERRIAADHRSYRCGHFVVERGDERCYFVTVRRGRGARAFADVLYASAPDLLAECIAHAHLPLLATHGTLLTGIDRRLLRGRSPGVFVYRGLRPLMFRSDALGAEDIDNLYTELVPMYG